MPGCYVCFLPEVVGAGFEHHGYGETGCPSEALRVALYGARAFRPEMLPEACRTMKPEALRAWIFQQPLAAIRVFLDIDKLP